MKSPSDPTPTAAPVNSPATPSALPNSPNPNAPDPNSPEANSSGPNSLDIELAAALRITIHRLVRLLRRETRNDAQLSLTERATLGLLYPDNRLAPSDIARSEKVTTQSMSQVINHLAELDYIQRTPSDEDKRKVVLTITATGKAYVEQLRKDKQEWMAGALQAKTNPQEKLILQQALQIINKLVDE